MGTRLSSRLAATAGVRRRRPASAAEAMRRNAGAAAHLAGEAESVQPAYHISPAILKSWRMFTGSQHF